MIARAICAALLLGSFAAPALAHKLIEPGVAAKVADGAFNATSGTVWNRLQQSEGKYQEVWTIDGHKLNRLAFYGGVPFGQPLLKERDKKKDPLPKVTDTMLLPDVPGLLERTYRTQYGIPIFTLGTQEPAMVGGKQGIHFEYTYVSPEDEVERRGDAYAAIEGGKLFLVTYEAPALHYFDRDVAEVKAIIKSLSVRL